MQNITCWGPAYDVEEAYIQLIEDWRCEVRSAVTIKHGCMLRVHRLKLTMPFERGYVNTMMFFEFFHRASITGRSA
jgi:hypothetical protein